MPYTVRLIAPADDVDVERVVRSCLKEFGADHAGTAWEDPDLGRFSSVYAEEGRAYWVAVDGGGSVVGGVGIGELAGVPGVCELQKMYCLPQVRGTGVAQDLLGRALAFAEERYARCYLETLSAMTRAHRFYERNGFRPIDTPLGHTGHGACDILYIRDL